MDWSRSSHFVEPGRLVSCHTHNPILLLIPKVVGVRAANIANHIEDLRSLSSTEKRMGRKWVIGGPTAKHEAPHIGSRIGTYGTSLGTTS